MQQGAMLADDIRSDTFPQQRCDSGIYGCLIDRDQAPIREVPQPGTKPESQHRAERKHVVCGAASVSVMLRDFDAATVV
jgi:hypothetical protein